MSVNRYGLHKDVSILYRAMALWEEVSQTVASFRLHKALYVRLIRQHLYSPASDVCNHEAPYSVVLTARIFNPGRLYVAIISKNITKSKLKPSRS